MTTLSIQPTPLKPRHVAWRDGEVLDEWARRRAGILVAVHAPVRITPEHAAVPAGWQTLEQALATLTAVYGYPLHAELDDRDIAELYGRPDVPELGGGAQ